MPSHCRSGLLGHGPINLQHPGLFSFGKPASMMDQSNVFDLHRAFQVDSCTSTFHPSSLKDDPSLPGNFSRSSSLSSILHHPASSSRMAVQEDVDVETILQMNEFQDWTWPSAIPVDNHIYEAKPLSILSELSSLPFASAHSMQHQQLTSPSSLPNNLEQKGSTRSLFAPCSAETSSHILNGQGHGPQQLQQQQQQSFELQSWCSGARSIIMSPHVAIPRLLCDTGGLQRFATSAEPSPTTATSPLRLDSSSRDLIQCSSDATLLSHSRSFGPGSNSEPAHTAEKSLAVQKTWQGKRAVTQRESHIWSERQRRKGMNHLFSTLRSLLPQPTSKTDKSTVVSEIIKYIHGLQGKLDELSKRRAEILHQKPIDMTARRVGSVVNLRSPPGSVGASNLLPVAGVSSGTGSVTNDSCLQSFVMPNVALHISGNNAFITMSCMKKKGIFSRILLLLQSHKLDVINAHISTTPTTVFHCLHVLSCKHGGDFPKELLQTALQNLTLPESL